MTDPSYVDQILTSLKVIGKIKEGQKVRVRNGLLSLEVQSTGIITSITRWIHSDNRYSTIRYIKNVVTHAMELPKSNKIQEALKGTLSGLSSLAVTYGDDAGITATIDVMSDRIRQAVSSQSQK